MERSISILLKTNKIEKGKDYYNIRLNIPNDFVYNVSKVIVRWFPTTDKKTVICDEIPENITENINKFAFLSIEEFIKNFEKNLLIFFIGKVPKLDIEDEEILGDKMLSKEFKFPVHNNVTNNVKCDISKTNILLLCCQKINIVVKCLKCQSMSSITGNQQCKKCGSDIGLVYVPTVESDSLGYLKTKRSDFICFNPLVYQFSCEECNKAYESTEVGLGQTHIRKCNGCYKDIKFKVNSVQLYEKKEVKFIEGTELPEKGTCKHYKKSYRWFRFSCCGSVYPCDNCHNEQESHASEMANRMICGLCSKEQSVKAACECGMDLDKKKSQFWEGGKGNRNKATMSRKDSKKNKQ